ncbi:hypothetical protein [Paracoccus salsus]|uniref:hypothetical protein n=1 Tax=Paracoccus salsus TaxID=2911061 RepID=UPI001F2111AD|nr:hypothetical protein [Paracoccus salsus]MCF3972594.1 hypothetical protein [Paracoccus salsus]
MAFRTLAMLLFCLVGAMATAQTVDIEALKARIGDRAGTYGELVEILEGADGNASLAAFDVMMESGDKTLAEIALGSALAAADMRLRSRALWEVLSRRDSIVIEIDTEAIGDNEDAIAHMNAWLGPMQTWPLVQAHPETQCISLVASSGSCDPDRHISVSGLKMDIRNTYTGGPHMGLKGAFVLGADGVLHGKIASLEGLPFDYPATITLR